MNTAEHAGQYQIKRATRQGVIPLVGLYAESGCGKTMSALLLARGLVGASGDIHMIDTESRRGSLYADVIPGGYSVLDLEPPFTPERYIEATQAVIAEGAKVIVVDSMSHEWEGMGGVLDMAGENEDRTKKSGLHNWKQPKFEHAKLVQFLLRCPVPLVVCIRAKYKTRQKKINGETKIVKDDVTSPIQADDFIFEMTAHAEILPDHSINLTKCSHPDLRKCFPESGPIAIQHGEMIAKWCAAGASGAAVKKASVPTPSLEDRANKKKLWDITQHIHNGDTAALEAFLVSGNFLEPGCPLSGVSSGKLKAICAQVEEELKAAR
jgi:hypothetical protein